MNKYIGIGRITKDIELRTTSNNKSVSQFTIAINEGYGEEQRTNYIDCTVWGKQAAEPLTSQATTADLRVIYS